RPLVTALAASLGLPRRSLARLGLERVPPRGELPPRKRRSRGRCGVLGPHDPVSARSPVRVVPCRSRRHPGTLGGQLPPTCRHPADPWVVSAGGLSAEPGSLRSARRAAVRRLVAQAECALCRAHLRTSRLQRRGGG